MEKRVCVLLQASDFHPFLYSPWCVQGPYPGRHLPVSGQICSTLDLLYHEDRGTTFLRGLGKHLSEYTVPHPRRQKSVVSLYAVSYIRFSLLHSSVFFLRTESEGLPSEGRTAAIWTVASHDFNSSALETRRNPDNFEPTNKSFPSNSSFSSILISSITLV